MSQAESPSPHNEESELVGNSEKSTQATEEQDDLEEKNPVGGGAKGVPVQSASALKKGQKDATAYEPDKVVSKNTLMGVIVVYFSVFLDMMGVSIVQPILPFYAEKFGANATQLGALYSAYSLASLGATLMMGWMSDKYGRKITVLYSLFGTMIGYLLIGLSWNYYSLLAFRFVCGAFGGSAPIAQAYVTDVIPKSKQPGYLAYIGATISVSFIIGPGMGSGLSQFGLRVPFFVSSAMGACGLLFAGFVLRETNPKVLARRRKKNDDEESGRDDSVSGGDPPAPTREELAMSWEAKFIMVIQFIIALAWSAYVALYAFYTAEKFGFESLEVGFVVLCSALVLTATTVILFRVLAKKLGLWKTLAFGLTLFATGFVILPGYGSSWLSLAGLTLLIAPGFGLINPCMSSLAASYTNVHNRGKILGFVNAMTSLSFIVGPILNGVFYQIWPSLPFYISSGMSFFIVATILIFILKNPDAASTEKGPSAEKSLTVPGPPKPTQSVLEWEYVPDIPKNADYDRLGRMFGELLSNRNYRWVTYFESVERLLDLIFPAIRTNSLANVHSDIQMLFANANEFRSGWDDFHANLLATADNVHMGMPH